ncbi:MAG: hypothetical protein WCN92_10810 [Eubacteriales bacterium]
MLTKGWCFGTIVERLRNGNGKRGEKKRDYGICQKNSGEKFLAQRDQAHLEN